MLKYLLFLFSLSLFAQTNVGIKLVNTAPSGATSCRSQPQMLVSGATAGTLYTPQGTSPSCSWAAVGGGSGSGCSPSGTIGQILSDSGTGACTSNTTGTGILTALGVNVGSAGAPVVFNGALGTPSSGVMTNMTGLVAAAMPNAGVHTGSCLGTFPAITCPNAVADGATLGLAAFTAADFNSTSGVISLDYTNGQKATGSVPGFLSAADWTTFNGKGAGSVTTVGFTGGLISVANPTTTPALTVAGTSGGIPYFSAASTWASSGAGVQNAMMAWGGAGNAPTSPLSLLVTNQNAANETWTWYNSTATTGKTTMAFRYGAGQATNDPLFEFFANNGTTILGGMFNNGGTVTYGAAALCVSASLSVSSWTSCGSATGGVWFPGTFQQINSAIVSWVSASTLGGAADISVDRDAAGILGVTASGGTTAANYRAIKASAHYVAGTTFTASGCSNGTLVGGATSGKMTLGAASCTVVVTMGNSATAPNGWACSVEDQTTAAALVSQSASTTTTASFSVPVAAGGTDVLVFGCFGY